jgi:hypothetical protein
MYASCHLRTSAIRWQHYDEIQNTQKLAFHLLSMCDQLTADYYYRAAPQSYQNAGAGAHALRCLFGAITERARVSGQRGGSEKLHLLSTILSPGLGLGSSAGRLRSSPFTITSCFMWTWEDLGHCRGTRTPCSVAPSGSGERGAQPLSWRLSAPSSLASRSGALRSRSRLPASASAGSSSSSSRQRNTRGERHWGCQRGSCSHLASKRTGYWQCAGQSDWRARCALVVPVPGGVWCTGAGRRQSAVRNCHTPHPPETEARARASDQRPRRRCQTPGARRRPRPSRAAG